MSSPNAAFASVRAVAIAMAKVMRVARDLHAAAAAAGRRLHQHGKADPLGDLQRFLFARDRPVGARHAGNAEPPCRRLGFDLVAHQADMLGLRADEGDVVLVENLGEARVLREETIARMHGVRAGDLAGGEQGGNIEIGIARGRRPDADGLVGELDMHGVGVGRRMHGDCRDAEFLGGAQDAQRDFAAIGDKDLVEHLVPPPTRSRGEVRHIRPAGRPRPVWPSQRRIWCATMSLKVFIASISSSLSPSETRAPISTKGFASGFGRR